MKNKLLKTIATTFLTGAMLVSALAPAMTVKAETVDTTPIYRLYNPDNGEHLYTTDANERDVLYSSYGWGYEGIAWYASTSGTPVYRLYNNVLCNHLYTTDLNEIKVLTSMPDTAWTVDNNNQPLFYSDGEVPIYRVYNEGLQGMHHLTTDKNEYDTLPTYGWAQEGISLYAISIGEPIVTEYEDIGNAPDGKATEWYLYDGSRVFINKDGIQMRQESTTPNTPEEKEKLKYVRSKYDMFNHDKYVEMDNAMYKAMLGEISIEEAESISNAQYPDYDWKLIRVGTDGYPDGYNPDITKYVYDLESIYSDGSDWYWMGIPKF